MIGYNAQPKNHTGSRLKWNIEIVIAIYLINWAALIMTYFSVVLAQFGGNFIPLAFKKYNQ